MSILYLWQNPTWQDFLSEVLEATDTCILIGDGILAAVLWTEKPILPCPLLVLAQDVNARHITLSHDFTAIDDTKWLQLILTHNKVVSF